MQAFDHNIMIQSMEEALLPPPGLIDGRTERDWLCLLTDFASLINFYDSNNSVKGNWTPFLVKDPVLLLANISKTPFLKFYSNYSYVCAYLEKRLDTEIISAHPVRSPDPIEAPKELAYGFNRLFDELIKIFMCIKRWIYYLKLSVAEYALKTYVLQQVKSVYSRYFWALLSLRQNLFLSGAIRGINPVDHAQFFFFDAYEEMIWKEDKDKTPYWDTLGIKEFFLPGEEISFPLKKEGNNSNIAGPVFKAVAKMGNELLGFFKNIITRATAEFEIQKEQKSKYPDTLLLRTFVNLLQTQQEQLNGLTAKHLQFYYKDILKQSLLPAIADEVYVCAGLVKKETVFTLPAGTMLNAGTDAQNNPILFYIPEKVHLNPAQITAAYTLYAKNGVGKDARQLYIAPVKDIGEVVKNETGNIQTWETFGGSFNPAARAEKPAIAFASPLFLLREGDRYINITLLFKAPVTLDLMQSATYSLSTQNVWFQIDKANRVITRPAELTVNECSVVISIQHLSLKPPIEAFITAPVSKNPDGYATQWPVLKIEFDQVTDFVSPPELEQLTIDVTVIGLKTMPLYNDFGPLNTKAAYPLLGPAPLVNSNFIFGSDELFSKPATKVLLQLNWDTLPVSFAEYYNEYNFYLTGKYSSMEKPAFTDRVIAWIKKSTRRLSQWFAGVFKIKKNTVSAADPRPFHNTAFTVGFENLTNKLWGALEMQKAEPFQNLDQQLLWHSYTGAGKNMPITTSKCDAEKNNDQLFTIDGPNCYNSPSSCFVFDPLGLAPVPFCLPHDPQLQLMPLQYNGQSSDGFMKMHLKGPSYGFGSGIYASVVSKMAMYNAWLLVHQNEFCSAPPAFKNQAKLPFVPKLSAFTVHYKATEKYTFTPGVENNYPLQCFLYTALNTYKVYDSAVPVSVYNYTIINSADSTKQDSGPTGIPLYQPVFYNGYLLLQLENILLSNELNLYFEMSAKCAATASLNNTDFFYLSTEGWKVLPVLSDGTNGLSCTGIIKVNIPDDMATGDLLGTTGQYWIAIAAKGNPGQYPQVAFLNTNGMRAKRSSLYSGQIQPIEALTIQKCWKPVAQVSSITQPFPSFGGKMQEEEVSMNQRIANRIKTKNRLVSSDDYYRVIRQEYEDIFYSGTVFDPAKKITTVYVVRAAANSTEPNAFIPLVNEVNLGAIQQFLNQKASAFSNITVSNFSLHYIKVNAGVQVQKGAASGEILENVSRGLNIYLSPWIKSNQQQIAIGQAITVAKVMAFIKTIDGVLAVDRVAFTVSAVDCKTGKLKIKGPMSRAETIQPLDGTLFISNMTHTIKCIAANE